MLIYILWMLYAGLIGGAVGLIRGGHAYLPDGTCGAHQFDWECRRPDPFNGWGILLVPPTIVCGVIVLLGWVVTGSAGRRT